MTLAEALNIPKGMDFEEYEKLLKGKRKLEKQIAKLSADIDFESDSLEVLADEVGSERHNKHSRNKQRLESKREKSQEKLNEISRKLTGI